MNSTSTHAKPLTDQQRLTLRHLVQHVARTFFDVEQIVALDQLAKHDVLKDEDLAGRIGANTKETAKRLGKLVNSGLATCHSQNEQRDANTNRSSVRKYYYIDYPIFVNLVKWGIAEMRKSIDDKVRNELAHRGYVCPSCRAKYTMFDADRLFDPFRNGFFCEVCGAEVADNNQEDDDTEGNSGAKGQKMQRFNARTERIVSLLKKTDEIVLPKLDILDWVRKHAEAQHAAAMASAASQANTLTANADGTSPSKGYEGLKIAGLNGTGAPTASKVSVEIIDMDERETMRRRKEKEEEGAMRRQQNALPAWYTHSTISGEATSFGMKNDATNSPPTQNAQLPEPAPAILPSLSSLGGLDTLVTMDDEDDDEDEDEDVKPSTFAEAQPKIVEMTPEARADYYSKYYANLEAQQSESSSAAGLSVPNAGSQQAYSSAASSPALGSISSPLPNTRLMTIQDNGDSDSMFDGDDKQSPPSAVGRKRPREDDELADTDDAERPTTHPSDPPETHSATPATSGIIVHVNGVPMDFTDVTDDHHEMMTPEEYEAYFEVASSIG